MKARLLVTLLFVFAFLFPLSARSQQAGKFDYYLLTMSWSPEFCFSHQSSPECSKHEGLVVHGLWPQYNGSNSGPENCGQLAGPSNPEGLLDVFPTTALVEHEWTTHGTCSGLNADDYFALVRKLFTNFHAPPQLQQPNRQAIIPVADLKRAIAQANPGLDTADIALNCAGRYLSAVEICLTKDGNPQPCAALRECRGTRVSVPPIR